MFSRGLIIFLCERILINHLNLINSLLQNIMSNVRADLAPRGTIVRHTQSFPRHHAQCVGGHFCGRARLRRFRQGSISLAPFGDRGVRPWGGGKRGLEEHFLGAPFSATPTLLEAMANPP